ncbi:hypothetical protein GCM10023191_084720 [Actinoallomurus oryzae]|uniref:TPM domain-containing protein n=1 Tax=Actinoallomurus oryzae TaxID=502180 RepID=A0ABP8R0U7_9ACTN
MRLIAAAALALALAPAPAALAPAPVAFADAGSPVSMVRVDRVAAALRQSPVFVDPDVSSLLDAHERTALRRQIAGAGVPIYLAVVPLDSDDESAGDADYFTYLLHRRLGRDGIYLISDQRGSLDWTSYHVPRGDSLEFSQVTNGKPLPERLHDVLDAFARAPAAKPSDPPVPDAPEADSSTKRPGKVGLAGQFFKTFFPALAMSGVLLAFLWAIVAAVIGVARSARGSATTLRPRRLRRMAWAELVRLARAIGAAAEDDPGYPRAMADYDAAKLLWDEKQDPGSRFAVVVLSLDGQDALRSGTADPEPRCVVNPLHGTAARRVRTALGSLSRRRQPMCEECAKANRHRPLALVIDGRERPYYEAPGLWEKIRGTNKDLPEHVLEYLGVE